MPRLTSTELLILRVYFRAIYSATAPQTMTPKPNVYSTRTQRLLNSKRRVLRSKRRVARDTQRLLKTQRLLFH